MYLLLIVIGQFIYAGHLAAQPTRPWQIAPHLLNNTVDKKENYAVHQHAYPLADDSDDSESIFTPDNHQKEKSRTYYMADKAIDYAALAYMIITIYNAYTVLGQTPTSETLQQSNKLVRFLKWVCPQFLTTLGKNGRFLIDCSVIICQAFIYKTIAKLVLISSTKDITAYLRFLRTANKNSSSNA